MAGAAELRLCAAAKRVNKFWSAARVSGKEGKKKKMESKSAERSKANNQNRKFKRITVEEAITIPEVVEELSRIAGGVPSMKSGPIAGPFMPKLVEFGKDRIATMDADGVDMQVLSLTAPGVQKFDADKGIALAQLANDRLAEAVRAYPTRFAGLASVPVQTPAAAVKELDRAVTKLGLKGLIINSHTNGEYLDDPKFWPILEAAAALEVPLYIHPREPSPSIEKIIMIPGFTVGWGYAVETGTHALRLIVAGVFDRFPKLRIVLGHLGETIPFLLARMDGRYGFEVRAVGAKPLAKLPSEYFKDHFVVTTSGMNFPAPVRAVIDILGADRVLFAADYPLEDEAAEVKQFDEIPLTEEERLKISELNSRRVFGIDGPVG